MKTCLSRDSLQRWVHRLMNQTTSVNSFNDCKLVNFNVPNYLISQFDDLVKFKRKSRTSILLTLMETYLRDERTQIQKDNELTKSFKSIKEKYGSFSQLGDASKRVHINLKKVFDPENVFNKGRLYHFM